jgi:methanogenic corrinoid protein MtbC1
MEVLQPALRAGARQAGAKGVVVIGTVQGDIHDIGKTLVATLLSANGYEVIDLGADVPHERFIEKIREHRPDFLCMSALLTTTMSGQRRVIEMLEHEGVRSRIRVVVGGAPTSAEWAADIGADGHAASAAAATRALESFA